jgi:hypothetical protein
VVGYATRALGPCRASGALGFGPEVVHKVVHDFPKRKNGR